MISPGLKSCIYSSVCQELKCKNEQGKPTKKATHEVLKERWGIENVPSGSHEPSMNQSYKISCQLIKSWTNTLKKN